MTGRFAMCLHGGYLMLMRRRLQSAVHGRLLEQAEGLRREADCRRHLLAALPPMTMSRIEASER